MLKLTDGAWSRHSTVAHDEPAYPMTLLPGATSYIPQPARYAAGIDQTDERARVIHAESAWLSSLPRLSMPELHSLVAHGIEKVS